MTKKIILGADHGGFALKEKIKSWLEKQNYEVVDMGAQTFDAIDDYPDFASKVARQVIEDKNSLGILFCRSGAGMTIAANKIKGARAVDLLDVKSAQHAREHNNANIMSIGADFVNPEKVEQIVKSFIRTDFTAEPRHQRRIDKISNLES